MRFAIFSISQVELQLSDVWPSRRSRSWWVLTSSFIGQVPLVPWPKSDVVTKVAQVLPSILPWDPNDEEALALVPVELCAFGADTDAYVKYLLNFEGCAPCALHAWGSQVVACQCGCRSSGLSPMRLQEKGLFGLLVFTANLPELRRLRHIHPCECNALNGFDPVIDFGPNPRLTLAASGQMASPLQTAWVFAKLAERILSLKQISTPFCANAMLQALMSWTLMRCRQVWPCSDEPVQNENMRSLIGFWKGFEHLSIHELMHPPRWPALAGHHFCIASVLDLIIRGQQCRIDALTPIFSHREQDSCMVEDGDDAPTPWIEQPDSLAIACPHVSSGECVVVLLHESANPIRFGVHAACTVHDLVQAHTKLVGDMRIEHICNQHGVEIPLSHVVECGQIFFIRCSECLFSVSNECAKPEIPTLPLQPMPSAQDKPVIRKDGGDFSPTCDWSEPIREMPVTPMPAKSDRLPGVASTEVVSSSLSVLPAAPLLGLNAEQLVQLQVPVVRNTDHLDALKQQLLLPDDRHVILHHQLGTWADDEFRFHLDTLRQTYVKNQQGLPESQVKNCVVLDPLLLTGWIHYGYDECGEWSLKHPEIRRDCCPVISCCMIDGHWILIFKSPVAGNLHVATWDDASRDHSCLQDPTQAIGKALGFSQVFIARHHRLFFSSDKCGAMAIAFLNFALLNGMLPTCHEEVGIIHDRLRLAFVNAVNHAQFAQRPWIWGAGDKTPAFDVQPAQGPGSVDAMHGSFSHQCIAKERRLHLLSEKGKQFGDDEIRFHMLKLLTQKASQPPSPATAADGFVMMDPLLLSTWQDIGQGMCESWCRNNKEQIAKGLHIVAVFFLDGHWFPVWFNYPGKTIVAHRIADDLVTPDTILPILKVLRDELGFEAMVEHVIPHALPPHQLCGAAAISFISHLVLGTSLPSTVLELGELHASYKAEFVKAVHDGTCCICPVAWGSGAFAQLIGPLSAELLKHGVPPTKVEQRAQQALKAIGIDNIATALKSKNVWRSLKTLGSNVRFQFLLPDELEAVVQANKGNPVGKKSKQVPLKTKPTLPDMIDPTKLALLDGTFRVQNQPVPQLQVQQIGPVACGVVLIGVEEAMPYLKSGRLVSSEPLALAVLTPSSTEIVTSLPHAKIMMPCMCVANSEPLLVEVTLVQLGQGLIEKHVASTAIELDQLDVSAIKMMVYHDEFSGQWEDFCAAPIKHLVAILPILRRCTSESCQCDCWHNAEGLPVKDPIMDVWRRQFLSGSFKPVKASKAEIFSVCLRVPTALVSVLLSLSGQSGVYMEQRTPDGREVLPDYAVIWTPKLSSSEVAHLRQTNPAIIGFARLGERKGFRVLSGQAKTMHELVRPEAAYLPSGPKCQYVAGPFPWGSDRHAIVKAMKQAGWTVKALQPLQPVPGRGSMWLLQTVDEPPEAIIQTTHGEVVITKHKDVGTQSKLQTMSTVGSASTLSLCGSASSQPAGEPDPWVTADPWGSYNKQRQLPASTPANAGLQQLEERLQSAILAKIPTAMDQDDLPDRMSTLEGQVQLLMSKHHVLEGQMQDLTTTSTQNFAVVQQQIQQQSQSFHGQFESHAQGIQAMFTQQMEQIRGLLAKRPRDDNME